MKSSPKILVIGIGSFAQAMMQILKENGAEVYGYLNRDYGHYAPSLAGPVFLAERYPSPCPLIEKLGIDFVIPMDINWRLAPWADDFLALGVPIFAPTGEGMRIERERAFAQQLCQESGISFPKSFVANSKAEAEHITREQNLPFVIKNRLCSVSSPVHTILCETPEDTLSWLHRIDFSEGVFLQEFMGRREAGHIAFISNGEIHPILTNQEYKRAFDGNMGIIAGAPLGGIVEADPNDKYGLARDLLMPLLPWFKAVHFNGPIQVTGIFRDDTWHVLEYNVRIGVTCGPIILRMFHNPVALLQRIVQNKSISVDFEPGRQFGCMLTLAGYGYPFIKLDAPRLPVEQTDEFSCDVWWNEVEPDADGMLHMAGHRLADITATGERYHETIDLAYQNIKKIRCLSSYYRTDIGQSMWPPGNE